jgi:hypothetical protein
VEKEDGMKNSHQGFLYGHYDSRGGTTFIAEPTQEKADARYAAIFGMEAAEIADAIEEDRFGPATLYTNQELEPGEELESTQSGEGTGKVLVAVATLPPELSPDEFKLDEDGFSDAFLFGPGPFRLYHVVDGEQPPEPCVYPRWDDDAFGFNFNPAE